MKEIRIKLKNINTPHYIRGYKSYRVSIEDENLKVKCPDGKTLYSVSSCLVRSITVWGNQDVIQFESGFNDTRKKLTNNSVKKPNHYIGELGLEIEEVLRNFLPTYEDSYVSHRIGSAMEYLARAPRKNGLEDLKKAAYNIKQAIEYTEKRNDVIE